MNREDRPVTVTSHEEIYRCRVFRLEREQVVLGNGTEVSLDIIRHPGASAILPLTSDGRLLMLRQYRHAVGGFIWEIPAGTLNPGEDPLACAHRELAEETGFSARSMEKIGEITPLPGYSDERIHLYVAADLTPAEQRLDEDEWLHVEALPIGRVMEMVREGAIQDGKTLCSLLFLEHGAGRNLHPAAVKRIRGEG
ncbi:NUDIX domain-containing protein [Desulfatiglans anilini]|uniref:NUDIX domain-containing protein n=1 Tax=Desulfatiglans anilini TaxID=90728 RepID=UPI0003FD854F|nr:NUDIX hydrolase [Desulfatiglans anilini]